MKQTTVWTGITRLSKSATVGASIARPSRHRNPIKNTLSIFLSLVMLLSITAGLDLSAYAATSGDYEYSISNGGVTITKYKGNGGKVTIPSKIGKYKVTCIGTWSFSGDEDNNYNENIKKIIIPNTVKEIGDYAFYNLAIESVSIGNNVKIIGESAFKSCVHLKNIVIPDSVTKIGNFAFQFDYNIETIKIGKGLKSIGYDSFPHGVFNYNHLKSISVDNENKYYSSEEGVLFNKNKTKLLAYPDNKTSKTYYIPTSVRSFGFYDDDYVFCTHNLENIIIPKNVPSIDNVFFMAGLKTVTVLNKNCKIGESNYFDRESSTSTSFKGLKNSTIKSYAESIGCKFTEVIDAYGFKIMLSSTSYTYNGKVRKPRVTVKNSKGKKIDNKYYTVSYSKGRKNVGKYTVTIKFKGNYSGIVKKTFTIKPKTTSISKLTAGKKKFTVKWNKRTTQTTGYQIQYSTSSKFKSAKTVTISKNSTTSKTIAKLKAKKKYYVRIRTYKTVNGKKIYSSWSNSKAVIAK